MIFVDGRIPVIFADAAAAGAEDYVLRAPDGLAGHAPGCACCVPRSALGEALAALFLRRVRGEVAWFSRVVVVAPDAAAAREALASDGFVSGRFRLV
jgi:hypothetical protein